MANEPALYARMEMRVAQAEKQMAKFAKQLDGQMGGMERRTNRAAKNMERSLNSSFSKMQGSVTSLGATFAAGFAGGAFAGGVSGAVSGIRSIITETANLRAEAARAGVSLTAFQQWKAVAEDTRIPLDAMVDALKELNIRADEFATTGKGSAAEAFGRLGMTPEEVQKKLRDPSQLMTEIIDKTRALNNQAAATRIFDEVFGGTGAEQAVRLLDQADGSIQDIMKSAQSAGRILDENMVKRAEEIDREFNTLWRNFESSAKTAILNVSIALKDGLAKDMGNIAAYAKDLWNDPNVQNLNRLLWGDNNDMRVAGAHGPATASDPALVEAARRKYGTQPTEITVNPTKPDKPTKSTGDGKSRVQAVDAALKEAEAVKELIKDLQFEAALVGKSEVEKAKMVAIRQAGAAATAEQKTEIEGLIESTYRQNEAWQKSQVQLQELNDMGREFAGTMVSGLLNGAKASDVLSDALGRLAERFLNSGLDALFGGGGGMGGLFGGLFGGGGFGTGFFPPIPGGGLFASGGYTGAGGKNDPAGIVHKGEVVWSQKDVARAGGVGVVEAMRKGIAGYSGGGAPGIANIPSISTPRVPTLPNLAQTNNKTTNNAPVINVNVHGATGNTEISTMVQAGVAAGIDKWKTSSDFKSRAWEQADSRVTNPRMRSW